jgi:hypothetical protein
MLTGACASTVVKFTDDKVGGWNECKRIDLIAIKLVTRFVYIIPFSPFISLHTEFGKDIFFRILCSQFRGSDQLLFHNIVTF